MDALLASSPKWTGGKQRPTATQLWRMLRAEGIYVGATLVKDYEWKRKRAEVFVTLAERTLSKLFIKLLNRSGKFGIFHQNWPRNIIYCCDYFFGCCPFVFLARSSGVTISGAKSARMSLPP